MALSDNDLFVYQDHTTSNLGSVQTQNLGNLADDDLFIVQKASDGSLAKVKKSDLPSGGGDAFTTVDITPQSITPTPEEQSINCTTNIPTVNGSVPADVKYEWYQYDDATGTTGQTPLSDSITRSNSDSIILSSASSGKYIGVDVTYLAETKSETNGRCQVGTPTGPTAVMHGLRFDSDRSTELNNNSAFDKSWTFSAWIKPSGQKGVSNGYLLSNSYQAHGVEVHNSDDSLRYNDGNMHQRLSNTLTLNEWQHVLVQCDADEMQVTGYVNGVQTGKQNIVDSESNRGNVLVDTTIGLYSDNGFNGYMSDVYMCGAIVPPEVFGKEFAAGWGPRDGSVVKTLLKDYPIAPYDARPNMARAWSDYWDGDVFASSNSSETGAFSEPVSSLYSLTATDGGTLGWMPTGVFPSTGTPYVLEVQFYDSVGATYRVNGNDVTAAASNNAMYWKGEVDSIDSVIAQGPGNARAGFKWFKVDGRYLIEGPVNNSENWSNDVTGDVNSEAPAINGFDGSIDTYTTALWTTFAECTFTASGFTPGDTIEVTSIESNGGGGNASSNNCYIEINGTRYVSQSGDAVDAYTYLRTGVVDADGNVSVTYNSLTNGGGVGWIYTGIRIVKVGGITLIDGGWNYNTNEVWSNYGAGAPVVFPSTNYEWPQAFDGDLTTSTMPPFGGSLTFKPPTTMGTSCAIWYNQQVNNNGSISVNGVTQTLTKDASRFYKLTIDEPLESFVINRGASGGGADALRVSGVVVDGELLVNGGFGAAGFYLPFDPDAVGVNYSAAADWAPYGNLPQYAAASAFDGNTQSTNAQSKATTATLNFSGFSSGTVAIVSNSIGGDGGSVYFEVNGTKLTSSNTTESTLGNTKLFTYNTPVALSTITQVNGSSNGDSSLSIYGVYFDGVLLVDHNNIGVDFSGNNNDFVDSGLAVGNTDKYWPADWTNIPEITPGRGPDNMFDGDASSASMYQGPSSGISEWNLVSSNVVSLDVYIPTQIAKISINNGPYTNYGGSDGWFSVDIGSGALTNPNIKVQGNGGTAWYVAGWRVNGKILINPNLQDTVFDTPMNSYAVLSSDSNDTQDNDNVSNGNLTITLPATSVYGVGTNTMDVNTGKYYGEVYMVQNYCLLGPAQVGTDPTATGNFWGGAEEGVTISMVYDSETAIPKFYKDGVLQATLSAGSVVDMNFAVAGAPTGSNNSAIVQVNLGQQAFLEATNNKDGTCTFLGEDYKLLVEPWNVWVSQTTQALLAATQSRVEALEEVFLAMAVDWSYGASYQANDIVKFNCSLHRALSNVSTRSPVVANSDVWENLYIDCERTHSMNLEDLIPDDWSQEQRQAALQELLQELSNEEPESY